MKYVISTEAKRSGETPVFVICVRTEPMSRDETPKYSGLSAAAAKAPPSVEMTCILADFKRDVQFCRYEKTMR